MLRQPFRMIEDNLDPVLITKQTIDIINEWLVLRHIKQNEVQKEMLFSHIQAMVYRAKTCEKLPDIDPEMLPFLDSSAHETFLQPLRQVRNHKAHQSLLILKR